MDAGYFSSARRLRLLPGSRVDASRLRGYYIDFRPKVRAGETWPPPWLRPGYGYVKLAQLALGHFERFVIDGNESSLAFARAACDHFVVTQRAPGTADEGGWSHEFRFSHRVELGPRWLSAMAQGQAASLLLRVYAETGHEEYAEAARRGMEPFRRPIEEGGVVGTVDGFPFAEEYPTLPQSHVLNGAIFAVWGVRDVAETLGDHEIVSLHRDLLEGLVATCNRWDLGRWSRYDLFAQPPVNVSSSFYHSLHISQLRSLHDLYGERSFLTLADRFASYQRQPVLRGIAFGRKVAYRLLVPRHKIAGSGSSIENSPKVSDSQPVRRS